MDNNDNVEIVKTLDGTKVVVVKKIIYRGKTKSEWDEIEKQLLEHIGDCYKISNTSEFIYVDTDFPDEFTRGKDKVSLRGANLKAKANIIQVLGELIEIADNKAYSVDYGDKHGLKAKNGWYRYDTRIALPVYNQENHIERYNIYKLRMLVRHDNDGKLYLYDFLRTKKEKEMSSPPR